ncbi:phosphoadenosine phosphosulfate reductase family protein [Succinivibrio dextrinosolvens]|uniref:phosphoadenosine phosphosulfate reductase domain-containing protein n=1 Tax=Succinivibrio dextrinosolvens TaxID=83771 RepID=UPI00241F05F2|nr:phosphoadenosine phosphosulfate reductase family protein [Succinivibrio dextrinosolvens]MBE6423242.1 phosphoadenosine phosphosulfate reductase [Succinivibrio dextrinosolvens]
MWCDNCKRETPLDKCEICGKDTEQEVPQEIFWCEHCRAPIIVPVNLDKNNCKCPKCSSKIKYLSSDLRPVFPEERLLIEILLAEPFAYAKCSVWANSNRYYIDGKSKVLTAKHFNIKDVDFIIEAINQNKRENEEKYYPIFEDHIKNYLEINSDRLHYIENEAFSFIQNVSQKYTIEQLMISFSGGKDSTCVEDLAIRALSNPSIVHVFGNTTLEFPYTYQYVDRFRKNNPKSIFKVAKNKEKDFLDVCEDIGPPSRVMRWCCTMFKTGPITRVINNVYGQGKILTFYGVRKCESASRSKYNRLEEHSESMKIQKQSVASPIFYWSDFDVWLYILGNDLDFNDAYRLGYDRVGCWCCPNNGARSQFLSRIYMPELSKKWRDFLIDFSKKIGKPDPEVYVDSGKWKARQGGSGLASAEDVKIKYTNCTTEENAKIYQLNKPFDDSLLNLFVPLGKISKELGRKLIKEVIVLDVKTNMPIISIQPFSSQESEYAVKIKTMNLKDHESLQRMVSYQIRKYNACRRCLKCESICKYGAITIKAGSYHINEEKCRHCKACVSQKYLSGGCLMDKYLRTIKFEQR